MNRVYKVTGKKNNKKVTLLFTNQKEVNKAIKNIDNWKVQRYSHIDHECTEHYDKFDLDAWWGNK